MHDQSMGSSSAELTLGRPSQAVSHGAFFGGGDVERMLKLDYYLKSLEDERKKIDAFKRELPLCMQLLNDEIEASKDQLADYQEPAAAAAAAKPQSILSSTCEDDPSPKSANTLPVLEEFIPIKKPDEEDVQAENGTKANGVIETKFWSQAEAYAHGQEMVSSMTDKPYKKRESTRMGSEDVEAAKPILNSQKRGGAFMPFLGGKRTAASVEKPDTSPRFRDGEAASPHAEMARSASLAEAVHHARPIKEMQQTHAAMAAAPAPYTTNPGQVTQRKPRRCWSPELHQRFVNALQQLGGSEVATPKQIRELMKVDGLTNDEVKSHLQKYRLHTRRPSPNFHASATHTPQVVVLGGIWVPQEYAAQAAAASVTCQSMPPQQEVGERQATHAQATPSYSEDRYIQLNPANGTPQMQLHPALFYNGEVRPAASAQSQGSSQGQVHQVSAHSSEAGREEESLGEEGNEECSWKEGYPREERMHEDNTEDSYGRRGAHNLQVHKWMYDSVAHESDSEADGRVYETTM